MPDNNAVRARVLLIGVDTPIGLAIVRELAGYGVEVHGIARRASSIGLYSRHLTAGYVRTGAGSEWVVQALDLARRLAPCHIMAISENDICLLNEYREQFEGIRLLIPAPSKMKMVLDKSTTNALAAEVGISVPRTIKLDSIDQLDEKQFVAFPVILKWQDPNAVAKTLEAAQLPMEKAVYCHTYAELHNKLRSYRKIGIYPLIQEYCPGYGLGQFLFLHRGEVLLKFQHKRVNEWPPEGGFSSLCESLPPDLHADLLSQSIALLRKMDWEGPAMVEYRYDPTSGIARLMEVNGRFWGSLPLAYHARAPFAWLTYSVLGNGERVAVGEPQHGLRCRFMVPEIKRIARILFQPQRIQDRTLKFSPAAEALRFFADFLSLRTRYYVFSLRDPKPFFADVYASCLRVASFRTRR